MPLNHLLILLTTSLLPFLLLSARGDLIKLPIQLLEYKPPTPDWRIILKTRIEAGEPLPDLPAPKPTLSDQTEPAKLLAHWRRAWSWENNQEPTPAVRAKILEAVEFEPSAIPEVLQALPPGEASARTVLALIDQIAGESHESQVKLRKVRAWIFKEAGLLKEQVFKDAWKADWALYRWEGYSDPTLEALLQRTPKQATRLFKEFILSDQPGLKVVGAHLLIKAVPQSKAPPYRKALISAAANVDFPEEARELAVKSLISAKWQGREQWIIESLKQPNPGDLHWFMEPVFTAPDHWVPMLIKLLENRNRTLRDHAVYLLAQFHLEDARLDSLRALLPWLQDPDWSSAKRMGRLRLIQSVDQVHLPEAVAGLRHVVRTDKDEANLAYAAESLLHYKAKESIPDLKASLSRCPDHHYRRKILRSIYLLDGYTVDEMLTGVLACYQALPTAHARRNQRPLFNQTKLPLEAHLGLFIINQMSHSPNEDLLKAIFNHLKKTPLEAVPLTKNLRHLILSTSSKTSRSLLFQSLSDREISSSELAATFRNVLKPSWDGAIFQPLTKKSGATAGFAAVLARDQKAMNDLMAGADSTSKAALIAAARLTQDQLPLASLASLLASQEKELSSISAAFLRDHHSPEARELLEQHNSDRAQVTGPRLNWDPGYGSFHKFDDLENQVGEQFTKGDSLVEVYALLTAGTWGDRGQSYLFVYPHHARAIQDFGQGRLGTCDLNKDQLDRIRQYIHKYRVDDLPPLELPIHDGIQMTFVHATKQGTRRVFMNNPPTSRSGVQSFRKRGGKTGIVIYAQLVNLFTDLFEELDLKLSYGNDVRIIIPKEKAQIESVWKDGKDLRVLVANSYKINHWQSVNSQSGTLLGPDDEPKGSEIIDARIHLYPEFEIQSDYHFRHPWQISAENSVVHPGEFRNQKGLWFCRRGQEPELITKGTFLNQLVSPDGKWCIASHAAGTSWAAPNTAVRINLETKEVFPIALKPADNFDTEAFVPAHGKFLISRAADRYQNSSQDPKPVGPKTVETHLLDAATGELTIVTGDFTPLIGRSSFRPPQPTTAQNVIWVSKQMRNHLGNSGTAIGRYNTKTFTFEPITIVEGIFFDSSEMWVDEENEIIYAALNSDLVSIPLPKD